MGVSRRTQMKLISQKSVRTITNGVDRVNCPKGGLIPTDIRPYSLRVVAVCNSMLDHFSRTGANVHSTFMKAAKETDVNFPGQLLRDSWPLQTL